MNLLVRCALVILLLSAGAARGGEEPDGTQFPHQVIAVDGPELLRIRYCGVPVQVRLANLQLKGGQEESECLKYLKDLLRPGTLIRIEIEPDLAGDTAPPPAQVFAGSTHVNLEMVKRGLVVSDGRSRKFGTAMQNAQLEAMNKKAGVWADADKTPERAAPSVAAARPAAAPAPPAAAAAQPVSETAPPGYSGQVVADLSSREYHFPGSRYASNIRPGARIEYKSPDEAERAGKVPSPFSFPERAKALADKGSAHGSGAGSSTTVESARKALAEALTFMQEARRVSKTNNALANDNYKKAAKLLTEHLDRVIPIADADPNNRDLQKLTEDLATNLYSCKKYQTL